MRSAVIPCGRKPNERIPKQHIRILIYGHYRIAYLIKPDSNIEISWGCFTAHWISIVTFFNAQPNRGLQRIGDSGPLRLDSPVRGW